MFKKLYLVILLNFPFLLIAQNASITEEYREFLTYPYSDPNPMPLVVENKFKLYPYHTFDGYSWVAEKKKWKFIKLENDYIEVYIMPEIGGKVWGAIEKSTGKEFIYSNDVVKFRNIAHRGPWTSGGIEFNLGLVGHTPSTASPVDYITRENSDGSVSCIVGSLDLPSRTPWRVEIRLPKDKAYFETIPLWYNPTPVTQSYYCFMTGAAAVSDDLEFFYPGNGALEHNGEYKTYPVQQGHLKSMYKNNNYDSHTSIHVVGDYNDFMGGYYHNSDFGFGHWALYNEMPGRKLWLWALSREGEIWKDLLTDKHSQYLEFQAGRTFNQYVQTSFRSPIKEMPFNPGVTDQWREIWFPVKQIGGMLDVSEKGVLNVIQKNGELTIGINALAFTEGKLIVKVNGKEIYSEILRFKPMEVYEKSLNLNDDQSFEIIVENMDLCYNPARQNLVKRTFVTTIKPDNSSASQDYQRAVEYKENRNYKPAKTFFKSCLKKDPLYSEAMVGLSELYYRSALYDSSLYYANQALQLDTYHPGANYFAGINYLAQKDFINALESFGWAARSMEFRSAAYAQMAGIEFQLKQYSLAEQFAKQSIDFNRFNFNALDILSILCRKQNKTNVADSILNLILEKDPLHHFADFENYLLHPENQNLDRFKSKISNEFPYQTYLELAIEYYNLGMTEEALQLLNLSPVHPLVELWKAFIQKDDSKLPEISKLSPAFVFPYRTETLEVMEWAALKNKHWKFRYYLTLNLLAIDRTEEVKNFLKNCKEEPDFATFYTTRALLNKSKDKKLVLSDFEKARQIDPNDWRNWSKLIDAYESISDFKSALSISSEASAKFPQNYNLALQHARTLLNNGLYSDALKVLEKVQILPFEGSTQGKVIYEQAYLFLSIDLIVKKKYMEALTKLEKSKRWPENLGVGMPFNPDNRIQDYLEAICFEKLGNKLQAEKIRDSVVQFTLQMIDSDLPSYNNILALWSIQKEGKTAEANELLGKLQQPDYIKLPGQKWVIATYLNDIQSIEALEHELTLNNYLKILNKLREFEMK
ncbi:MAG: DUF5107 domain-containing protein [Bacteroidales bacterium]